MIGDHIDPSALQHSDLSAVLGSLSAPGDPRRLGHAQRRRIGAPSNVYGNTIKPPTRGLGATVRARGRYGPQTVVGIRIGTHPAGETDGHTYTVAGGKKGRRSEHSSAELADALIDWMGRQQ